jgi:hypothetical protein
MKRRLYKLAAAIAAGFTVYIAASAFIAVFVA